MNNIVLYYHNLNHIEYNYETLNETFLSTENIRLVNSYHPNSTNIYTSTNFAFQPENSSFNPLRPLRNY
jgi:hypothetical protein